MQDQRISLCVLDIELVKTTKENEDIANQGDEVGDVFWQKIIKFDYILSNFKLYKAPLTETEDNFIRENQNLVFFLNKKNWI